MIKLREKYQTRPVRFLELWQALDWKIKVYGIAYRRALPGTQLLEAAKSMTHNHLLKLRNDCSHYNVGFLGVHEGRGANFIFFDYWADENELYHHVYVSPSDEPHQWDYVTPTGLTACVWDLSIQCFERQAWVETVLANPNGANLEAYLQRRMNRDV